MSTEISNTTDRKSVLLAMASKFGMEPAAFEQTIRKTCGCDGASREEFAAFLLVAHEYGLNPITKEIYAFPKKGGGVQPIVGVDGWIKLANSHPEYDGIQFEDRVDSAGKLVAVTARVYRKDRSHPEEVTEYLAECQQNTDPWRKWPARMLRHKARIQAYRAAFGFSGIVDPDEANRMGPTVSVTVSHPKSFQRRLPSPRSVDSVEEVDTEVGFDHESPETEATA